MSSNVLKKLSLEFLSGMSIKARSLSVYVDEFLRKPSY